MATDKCEACGKVDTDWKMQNINGYILCECCFATYRKNYNSKYHWEKTPVEVVNESKNNINFSNNVVFNSFFNFGTVKKTAKTSKKNWWD